MLEVQWEWYCVHESAFRTPLDLLFSKIWTLALVSHYCCINLIFEIWAPNLVPKIVFLPKLLRPPFATTPLPNMYVINIARPPDRIPPKMARHRRPEPQIGPNIVPTLTPRLALRKLQRR